MARRPTCGASSNLGFLFLTAGFLRILGLLFEFPNPSTRTVTQMQPRHTHSLPCLQCVQRRSRHVQDCNSGAQRTLGSPSSPVDSSSIFWCPYSNFGSRMCRCALLCASRLIYSLVELTNPGGATSMHTNEARLLRDNCSWRSYHYRCHNG